MKKTFLITIFFSCSCFAQLIHGYEATFTFSEASFNFQDLILGFDPTGTDGLDPDLGEIIVPQVPPGNFGVRFQLPSDTSIYTLKDIRFGCGNMEYYEYLVDINYWFGGIDVDWEWDWDLSGIDFIDPYTRQILASFEQGNDPSYYFGLPEKVILGVHYNIPLSWPGYNLTSPLGGEIIESGQNFLITWTSSLAQWMDIEFSSDAGDSWDYIAQHILASQNSFNWNVPNINSENCLIRLGEYPCSYDISDSVFTITTPVQVENKKDLPTEFSLFQNYPNPFNPNTKIKFTIPTPPVSSPLVKGRTKEGFVTLKVYDVLGNEVATLVNEEKPAGEYEVEFNVASHSGNVRNLPSGVYFYQLQAGSFVETKKMILMK